MLAVNHLGASSTSYPLIFQGEKGYDMYYPNVVGAEASGEQVRDVVPMLRHAPPSVQQD